MNKKIQIRTIHDIRGNIYNIYDIMIKNKWGRWISTTTYFDLNDAIKWHPDYPIEDLSTFKEESNYEG